jgi:hypothetical protein
MRLRKLLEATSYKNALDTFQQITGVDPRISNPDALKKAYRAAMMKHHPDRGGNENIAKALSDAYGVLVKGDNGNTGSASNGSSHEYQAQPSRAPETAAWAQAGNSGGYPNSSNIHRNDYTDVNFIKKRMWELSDHSRDEWSISGFDGHFFRGSVTVYGSPEIFDEMAKAMIMWQTRGGNPYDCRAVFVSKRRGKELLLVYADRKFYGKYPIPMHHDSFNLNPSNDQQFVRKLPEFLDDLRDNGRPDSGTADMGFRKDSGYNYGERKVKLEVGEYVYHNKYGAGRIINPHVKVGQTRVTFADGRTGNVKTDALIASTKQDFQAQWYHHQSEKQ